jgi:hypothetical protein
MCWVEQNVSPIATPSKRGFGSTVISDLAERSLGATVELDFPATGLSWRLRCPANEALQPKSSQSSGEDRKATNEAHAGSAGVSNRRT